MDRTNWLEFDEVMCEGLRDLEAVNGTPIVDVKPVLNRQLDG
jgi:tRNA (Thr-GGU) A37 N-methylase